MGLIFTSSPAFCPSPSESVSQRGQLSLCDTVLGLRSIYRQVLVLDWLSKLTLCEVEWAAADPAVKVVSRRERCLQQVAADDL